MPPAPLPPPPAGRTTGTVAFPPKGPLRPPPAAVPADRPSSQGRPPSLASVTTVARALPDRAILYARPGWGKTSFAAQSPGCLFALTRGEDGLLTLSRTGQVRPTPHYPDPLACFSDLLGVVDELILMGGPYQSFVLDSLTGALDLLAAETVAEKFSGSWKTYAEFGGYHGDRTQQPRLKELLERLDRLRERRDMSVWLLAHAEAAKAPNAEGADYLAWRPQVPPKHSWPTLSGWADLILFGHQEVFASKEKGESKAKARSGGRVIYTQSQAWFDAKQRHGLPDLIDCGSSAAEAWANFQAALTPDL